MTEQTSSRSDFSNWNGKPYFEEQPREGRHVYIVVSADTFVAFGLMDDSEQTLFEVQGQKADLSRFLDEMRLEGAEVTFEPPPINTNTGGDKGATGTTKPGRKDTK